MTTHNGMQRTVLERLESLETESREQRTGMGACIARVDKSLADFDGRLARVEGNTDGLKSVTKALTDELTAQRTEANLARAERAAMRGELASVHEDVAVRRWWVTLYHSPQTRSLLRHTATVVVSLLAMAAMRGCQ